MTKYRAYAAVTLDGKIAKHTRHFSDWTSKEDKKLEFVHTLNGSGLATSRLMVSLLENYQTPEGKIIVPKAL